MKGGNGLNVRPAEVKKVTIGKSDVKTRDLRSM